MSEMLRHLKLIHSKQCFFETLADIPMYVTLSVGELLAKGHHRCEYHQDFFKPAAHAAHFTSKVR